MEQEQIDKIIKHGGNTVAALIEVGLYSAANKVMRISEQAARLHAEEHTLRTLPLPQALWWYIENVSEGHLARTEFFFILRERVRTEAA